MNASRDMVGVFLVVGTSLLANAAKGRTEGDRPLGCWAYCCNAWRNLMSCPMSFMSKLPGLGEFKQILGQRLSGAIATLGLVELLGAYSPGKR